MVTLERQISELKKQINPNQAESSQFKNERLTTIAENDRAPSVLIQTTSEWKVEINNAIEKWTSTEVLRRLVKDCLSTSKENQSLVAPMSELIDWLRSIGQSRPSSWLKLNKKYTILI